MRDKQAAFTLIEVMITAVILMLLISFALKRMNQQEENSSIMEKRMKASHLMDRSISRLVAELRTFPPLTRDNGRTSMSYVACFDSGGSPVPSSLNTSEFVANELPDPTKASQLCADSQFEVHVVPSAIRFKNANVYVLSFDRHTQIQTLVFSSELILQGTL